MMRKIGQEFIYMAALAMIATFSFSSTLIAQDLKIGLLVPTAGPDQSLGEQVKAGAQFGIKSVNENSDMDFHLIWPENWDGMDVKAGLKILDKLEVDAVIVDLGPSATKEFVKLVNGQRVTPAILLSNGHSTLNFNSEFLKNASILQFGGSDEVLFRSSLKKWARDYPNLKSVVVVYDESDPITLKLGEDIAQNTLESLSNRNVSVNSISFSSEGKSYYKEKIDEVVAKKPDGIVLVAKYGDRENFIRGFRKTPKTYNVPIILSGPIDFSAMDFISENGGASVYYGDVFGDIFWSDFRAEQPDDLDSQKLAIRMNEFSESVTSELGWHSHAFSLPAVAAYNAIQIFAKVYNGLDGKKGSADIWQADNPWELVKKENVSGLTGTLRFSPMWNSIIPPSHLVVVENKELDVLELDLYEK